MFLKKQNKNFRNIYIIDSENTFNIELLPLKEVNEMDKLIVFMSENSKAIKPKVLCQLMRLKCEIEIEFVEVGGANALDFQLVVYLTKSCLDNFTAKHFVLSNDKGFEKAINYINKNGIGVVRLIEEPKTVSVKNEVEKDEEAKELESIKRLISPISLTDSELKFVHKHFMCEEKSSEFHNKLIQRFGSNGLEIYKKCRAAFNNR